MAASPWLGRVLKDTYRIDKQVGEGGTGLVFLGIHLRLKVAIAVKVLKQSAGELAAARFRKEAEITARLRHPNIVQVLDYDVTPEGHAYLVTEWLEGETLLAFAKRHGPMSAAAAAELLRPICDAVGAAHAAGVVHRDLKPANLFLSQSTGSTGEPLVKVLDFGIAKLTELDPISTEQGQTVGTPRYMSPEQIRVEAADEVGPPSDQFALGCIAYELVSGKPAFPGAAHVAMLAVLAGKTAPLPDSVPAAYRTAVARALSLTPTERYPNVGAFWRALSGEEVSTAKVTPTPPPGLPENENAQSPVPLRFALGMAAIVGAVVALLTLVVVLGREQPPLRPTPPGPALVADRGAAATLGAVTGPTAQPALKPIATPLPDAAAADPDAVPDEPPPKTRADRLISLRVQVAPSGSQLYVDDRLQRGASVSLSPGQRVRLRVVAPGPKQRCCPTREVSFTAPPSERPTTVSKTIALDCDRDCPIF